MPWTVGSVHGLDGDGEVAISKPVALAIVVDNVPAAAGVRDGTPPTYWGLGHLSLGTTSGFLEDVRIVHDSQLHLVEAREFTRLGYTLQPGVEITVTELLGSNTPTSSLMPWDRNPAPVILGSSVYAAGGSALASMFSYTVPSAKKLELASAHLSLTRASAASVVGSPYACVKINGTILLDMYVSSNVVGFSDQRNLNGGPLYLTAGTVVSAERSNSDTGGGFTISAFASGTLFDA